MKKILLALALIASMQLGYAQSKAATDAKKAVEKAEATVADAKKAAKAANWVKLGQAYLAAYNAPTATVVGNSKQELALLMGNEKPQAVETVTIKGETYEKQVFFDKNLYFDANGTLQMVEVTRPVYSDDVLAKALDAYKKAAELDPAKTQKDVAAGIRNIAQNYFQDAFTQYQLGDPNTASKYFGFSADAALAGPDHRVDTTAVYYAGVTALEGGDFAGARRYFDRAQSYGYEGDQGAIYANLATIALSQEDTLGAKKYLEDGFAKYPESGQIMTNLINLYISTDEDPSKLISLLDEAKRQMPDNASLYYVEGNILAQLEREDEAIAAYRKASKTDPAYEMGHFGEGVLHYNKALSIQTEAEALPFNEYKKYDELQAQLADQLKAAIAPFEQAFAISGNNDVKQVAADYLKRIYFIFRSESAENLANYEKYNAFLNGE